MNGCLFDLDPVAVRLIERVFGPRPNPMTPTVVWCQLIGGGVAVELSEGNHEGQSLYGVTVAGTKPDGTSFRTGREPVEGLWSNVHASRALADAHIERMRDHIRRNHSLTVN